MTTSLRARIAALSQADPERAGDLGLRGVLIAVLDGADVQPPSLIVPADHVRAKLGRGVPLLDGEAVPVPGSLLPIFDRLAVAWLADPEHGPSAEALLTAVRSGRLSVEQVLAEALAAHSDHLASLAEGVTVSAALLETLADLAVRPLLVGLARRLRPALALGPWEHGYCPICADWPIFGEGDGEARLRCGRCLTTWRWTLPRCPFEPAGIQSPVDAALIAGFGDWSIGGCDTCQRYLKLAASAQPDRLADVLLADLATWRLDRAGVEHGLSRPVEGDYRLELLDLDDEAADEAFDDG
jgi:FdhE protein